jgi:hypothetical protein
MQRYSLSIEISLPLSACREKWLRFDETKAGYHRWLWHINKISENEGTDPIFWSILSENDFETKGVTIFREKSLKQTEVISSFYISTDNERMRQETFNLLEEDMRKFKKHAETKPFAKSR